MNRFVFFLIGIFLLSSVSAMGFDNKLDYYQDNLAVNFSNWFGLGVDYGTAELKSHSSINEIKKVKVGSSVPLFYDFDFKEIYSNGLGEVVFKDMKTGEFVSRNYNFVYWGEANKDIYGNIDCKDFYKNGTGYDCNYGVIGQEKYFDWLPYSSLDIPNEKIRIGIKVDVLKGDYIDAVWTIAGKRLDKHAEYSGTGEFSNDIEVGNSGNNDYNVTLYAETDGIITQVRMGAGSTNTGTSLVSIFQNGVLLAQKESASYKYDTAPYVTFALTDYTGDVIQKSVDGGEFKIWVLKYTGTLEPIAYSSDSFNGVLFNYTSQVVPGRHSSQPVVPTFVFNETESLVDNAPIVSLTSPANTSALVNTPQDFEGECTDDIRVENVSLYMNGLYQGVSTTHTNGTYIFETAVNESDVNWSLLICDNASQCTESETWFFSVCLETFVNSSWSSWVNVSGVCEINDSIAQNRSLVEYDSHVCGETANVTYWDFQDDSCNYCSYSVVNSSWSSWENSSCYENDTILSERFLTTYDENYSSCYSVTSIESDLWNSGSNITYYEFDDYICDFCTPSLTNSSWSAWLNESICRANSTLIQNRSLVEYDELFCGEVSNTTYWEFQEVACNYIVCINAPTNSSWSSWVNGSCGEDNISTASRYLVTYDLNESYCGNFTNITYYEYSDSACVYVAPDKSQFGLIVDLDNDTNRWLLFGSIGVAIACLFFRLQMVSILILFVDGFIMLFSGINWFFSLLCVASAVVIGSYKK